MSKDDVPEFDPSIPATSDNLLDFLQTLTTTAKKDGEGWENLKLELLRFGEETLNAWQGKYPPTIKDIVPRIWGFYCGYMACHKNWAIEINTLLEEPVTTSSDEPL